MENIPEEFLDDGEFSDEYLWLMSENACKYVSYKRRSLENIAKSHNINPDNYKNKRILLEAIIEYWNDNFRANPEFHREYQRHFGGEIKL